MPYDTLLVNKNDFLQILNLIAGEVKSFRFIESKKAVITSSKTGFKADETSQEAIEMLIWVHNSDLQKYKKAIDGIHSTLFS